MFSAAAALAVLVATGMAVHGARERWRRDVQSAVQKPQQFMLHWLELRRQLARSMVLRSHGSGWNEPMAFAIDAAAVAADTDGDIALAMAAVRVDAHGAWSLTALHGIAPEVWPALQRSLGPMAWHERLLTPLPDGRVALAMPLASDQALVLLMDIPDLVRQLQSIDWPAGVQLRLHLKPAGGQAAFDVVTPGPLAGEAHRFESQELTPWGQWTFEWWAAPSALGGPSVGWAWTIAVLGLLAVGALSGFARQVMTGFERQRELNAALDQRVEARTAELSQANAHLAQTLHQLAEAEKLGALGRLVAGVAHQLNTPLGVITTSLSTAQEALNGLRDDMNAGSLKRSAAQQAVQISLDCLDLVARSAERASGLTDHFKQMTSASSHLERRRFRLAPLVEARASVLREAVERAGHRLVLDLDPDLWIDSHPLALEQVLDHLLQNALAHGLAGVPNGCLTLRAQAQGDDILLSVVDNGVGMDEGAQTRYFDPFFTTKMERGHSGLGGYAVYSIVVGLLGGQVHVESRLGQGTSVHLRLPVSAPGPAASSAPDRS